MFGNFSSTITETNNNNNNNNNKKQNFLNQNMVCMLMYVNVQRNTVCN